MEPHFQLSTMQTQNAMAEIRRCLPLCERYGLTLSEADVTALAQARERALADAGRVEFGGGILPKLIYAFCDSPYAERETWPQLLSQLQESFYYYKSEAEEQFSDDELIEFMVKVFNGRAQGSAEYLAETSLGALCRYAREHWDGRSGEDAGDLF